LNFGA
jgi:hypothetical protein